MNKVAKIEFFIVVLLIVIFVSTFIYSKNIKEKANEEKVDNSVFAISDVNRFFTIDSVVAKYFNYVIAKDNSSVLKILDQDYVRKNNITVDNITSFIGEYDVNTKSSVEEVYQVKKYKNIYKYYVKVALSLETIYDSYFQKNIYLCVTIDENTLTFSIEPISEIIYFEKIKEDTNNG